MALWAKQRFVVCACSFLRTGSVFLVMNQPIAVANPTRVLPSEDASDVLSAAQLCERYAANVYRFAAMVSRGNGEAEDLAQDSLERAIRSVSKFDPRRGTVEGWLWRIVVNAARDADRVRGRRWRLVERLIRTHDPDDDVDPSPGAPIGDEDLLAAVRLLPRRQRALIALRFGGGLDYAGVGAALGMSPAAAGVAVRRALTRLRRELRTVQAREMK